MFSAAVVASTSILEHLRARRRTWNLSFLDKVAATASAAFAGELDPDEAKRIRQRRIYVPSTMSSTASSTGGGGTSSAEHSDATSSSSTTTTSTSTTAHHRRRPRAAALLVPCEGCQCLLDPDDVVCTACRTPMSATLKWQAIVT